MDAATIQAKVYAGRGKAAQYIGLACNQFRPISAATPLGNQIGTLNAAFNASDPSYTRPNLYGKPIWFADLDGRLTQPGDYLVRQSDGATWFIAGQQQLLPIVAIDCNRKVYISRQSAQTGLGQVGYGGLVSPPAILGTPATPWPASILVGGRGQANVGIPADVKDAGWKILLPPSIPIAIQAADLIEDDQGKGYAVESAELTDLGWRLSVAEVHP